MNDDALLMFLNPVSGLTSTEIGIMRSYDVGRMICVPYSYDSEVLDDLESEFDGREIIYFEADGPDDMDLVLSIRNAMLGAKGKLMIDVTFASPYHSAVCTNLGNSVLYEVYYSRYSAPDEIMHERLDRVRHDYRDLSDTHYLVLDRMSLDPKMTEQLVNALKGKRSQSAIYATLSNLWDKGLIEKVSGKIPEGYVSRTPNFFRFNPDQQWDYYVYRQVEKKRKAEMEIVDRKRSISKQTKKNSLKSKDDFRERS